jgi:hypothetical protein
LRKKKRTKRDEEIKKGTKGRLATVSIFTS